MKEHVFLSNNKNSTVEDYWIMHCFNATNVLINRVNCSGNTFILTLFWRVLRDLHTLLHQCGTYIGTTSIWSYTDCVPKWILKMFVVWPCSCRSYKPFYAPTMLLLRSSLFLPGSSHSHFLFRQCIINKDVVKTWPESDVAWLYSFICIYWVNPSLLHDLQEKPWNYSSR